LVASCNMHSHADQPLRPADCARQAEAVATFAHNADGKKVTDSFFSSSTLASCLIQAYRRQGARAERPEGQGQKGKAYAPRDAVRGLDSALALVGASVASAAHPTEDTHRTSAQIGSPAGRVSGRLHTGGARAGGARRSHVQDQRHRAALLDQFRDPDAAPDMAVCRQHHGCGACWEDDHPTRVWRSVVHPAGILAGWGGSAQPRGIGRRRDRQSLRQTPQSGRRCARPRSALPLACLRPAVP
jgi:hypothetical protein